MGKNSSSAITSSALPSSQRSTSASASASLPSLASTPSSPSHDTNNESSQASFSELSDWSGPNYEWCIAQGVGSSRGILILRKLHTPGATQPPLKRVLTSGDPLEFKLRQLRFLKQFQGFYQRYISTREERVARRHEKTNKSIHDR